MRRLARRRFAYRLTLSFATCFHPGCVARRAATPAETGPHATASRSSTAPLVRLSLARIFESPPGTVRVRTVSRPGLEELVRAGGPGGHGRRLFYMGSEADWDYYLLAHHTFSFFVRVSRDQNPMACRMPLTGNSLAWRRADVERPVINP